MPSLLAQEVADRVALLVEKYSETKGMELDIFNLVYSELLDINSHGSEFSEPYEVLEHVRKVLARENENFSYGDLLCPGNEWELYEAYQGAKDFFDENIDLADYEPGQTLSDVLERVVIDGINKDMSNVVEFLLGKYGEHHLITAVHNSWAAAEQTAKRNGWDMQALR